MAHSGGVVGSSGTISGDRVRRNTASRHKPDEAIKFAVSCSEVNGRSPKVIPLVEDSQFSVGGREAVGVTQLRRTDGGTLRSVALSANV